ncbi:glycosyltransferase [Arthrobacter sp. H14]|uniref:glycosyltransferase n=1 Tax=Arthrobacter sp. H14 TaxID=1312959 RepID=UPI0004B27A44|nr:glycosyltransferase [Arthrobacter sp. H14]
MAGVLERPALLVATSGGHLDELHRLRNRLFAMDQPVEWVTHDGDQLASLLTDETVHVVPYIKPRGYGALAASLIPALRILKGQNYSMIVTTGAGIALPFVAIGRLQKLPCHYIESAARATRASLTGSIAARIPGLKLYTQYPAWAGRRWQYHGALFDGFTATDVAHSDRVQRVVVTLGTMRNFGFRRAVTSLLRVLPDILESESEVLWQTGCTDVSGLGITSQDTLPTEELRTAIASADLVVAHAGVGSALTALESGHRPLLLPRQAAHGEHIDDHQLMIAAELSGRGLAVSSSPDALTVEHLRAALAGRVAAVDQPPPFGLQ